MAEFDSLLVVGFVVSIVLIAAVDTWLWSCDGWRGRWTISEAIRRAAAAWWPLPLVVAFAFGLLVGHWFW